MRAKLGLWDFDLIWVLQGAPVLAEARGDHKPPLVRSVFHKVDIVTSDVVCCIFPPAMLH